MACLMLFAEAASIFSTRIIHLYLKTNSEISSVSQTRTAGSRESTTSTALYFEKNHQMQISTLPRNEYNRSFLYSPSESAIVVQSDVLLTALKLFDANS